MVSSKTVARMSRYRRLLNSLRDDRHQHLLPPARPARRGQRRPGAPRPHGDRLLGQPHKGYDVDACIDSIGGFLDGPRRQEVALVGVGNLGPLGPRALRRQEPLAGHRGRLRRRPGSSTTRVHGCRCFAAAHHGIDLVRDLGIQIAVLTVPPAAAQEVADTLVRAGVRSIISFAAAPLHLPNDIFVEYMDITAALESAAYFARGAAAAAETEAERRRDRADGQENWNPCSRGEMKLEDLARNIGARIVTGRARRHRIVGRSTPATASATCSTRPPTRRCW